MAGHGIALTRGRGAAPGSESRRRLTGRLGSPRQPNEPTPHDRCINVDMADRRGLRQNNARVESHGPGHGQLSLCHGGRSRVAKVSSG